MKGKRSETNGKPAKADEAPKAGDNIKTLTDDERAALHFRHVKEYEAGLDLKKKADADFKNVCKRINAEGGSVRAVKLTIDLQTPEGEVAFRARMAEDNEIAKWNGVGVQVDMFADKDEPAVDRAFGEGKRAGMRGDPNNPPYDPSVPQHGRWLDGYAEGNAVLASEGFKRLTPVEQQAAH